MTDDTTEHRILAIEERAISVGAASSAGTILQRVLTEHGVRWTLAVGGLMQPKTFFTEMTIPQCLYGAEVWLDGLEAKR